MSFDVSSVAGQGSIRPSVNSNTGQSSVENGADLIAKRAAAERRTVVRQMKDAESTRVAENMAEERKRESETAQESSRQKVEREVQQALKELKDINLTFNHKLKYTIDHSEEEIVVQVIDPDTDEVVKELPPLAIQKFHSRLQQYLGLIVDEEA